MRGIKKLMNVSRDAEEEEEEEKKYLNLRPGRHSTLSVQRTKD